MFQIIFKFVENVLIKNVYMKRLVFNLREKILVFSQ
jgi:hypothetical protein